MVIQSGEDIVRLAEVNADFGQFLQQLLEAEGIPCQIVGEHLYPSVLTGYTSWPELWVRRKDLAGAMKVLRVVKKNRGAEYKQEVKEIPESLARMLPWIVVVSFVIAIIIVIILAIHP